MYMAHYGFKEVEINKKRPSFIKSKERVAHIQKKLNSAKKSLEEVRRADEAHRKDITELEQELEEVETQRKEYEDLLAGESQSQGRDVQLEDAQVCSNKEKLVVIFRCKFVYSKSTLSVLGKRIQYVESGSSKTIRPLFTRVGFGK